MIGANTLIQDSIIGRKCKIGKDVRIINSIIWSNVTIEDGAVVENTIVGDSVTIKSGVDVGKNSLLCSDVKVTGTLENGSVVSLF